VKSYKFILLLLLFPSCIDLIIQEPQYNSLYFSGGSWIELKQMSSMKMAPSTNDFSLQFWISGGEVNTNEAPALFSLTDESGTIILSLLRDPNVNNRLTTVIKSQVISKDINNIDFSNSGNFYLISVVFSNNDNVKVYIDSTLLEMNLNNTINFDSEMLIVGAIANEQRTTLENFWYGYIDEIRLWNTALVDSTIKFQTEHPDKLGDHYRYTDINGNEIPSYLDSLIGIWRLNFENPQVVIEDDSGYDNDGYLYTINGYSVELSKKGAQ
jgi:hypothetical protein